MSDLTPAPRPPAPAWRRALEANAALFAARWPFLAFLGVYVVAHALLRGTASPALGRDDLIEAVLAQSWAWGYNPAQPPLYTWLIMAATTALGPGIWAHVTVKFGLLFAGYAIFYLAAERALGQARGAALATGSLLLIYMLGFDALHLYSHSVALIPFAAATLYFVLRLAQGAGVPAPAYIYVGLGLAMGGGLLSKYGFPLYAGTLILAGLGHEGLRRALLDRRMVLALGLAALIFLPHGLWMLAGPHDFRQPLAATLRLGAQTSYLAGVGAGLKALTNATFNFVMPFALVALLIFPQAFLWRLGAGGADPRAPMRRLFGRWLLAQYALVVLGVLALGVTGLANHHLLAVLLGLPIYVFLRVQAIRPSPLRLAAYAGAIMVAVVGAAGVTLARAVVEPSWCSRCYLHWDYAAVAVKLRAAGFASGTIVAEDHHVGGNLRTRFPQTRIYQVQWPLYTPASPPRQGACLVIWDAERRGAALPADMAAFLVRRFALDPAQAPAPRALEALYYGSARRTLKLGFILIPEGAGTCR